MSITCIICNEEGHQHMNCPVLAKAEALFKIVNMEGKQDFSGLSPAPFVGRYGYPKVNVGILAPGEIKEDVWKYDSPRFWAQENYQIPDVVQLRTALINSRFSAHVKDTGRFLEAAQEIGMASQPVDVELHLEQTPVFHLNIDPHAAPLGQSASLKDVDITSNPKIHTKVDRAVSDTDLKAKDALVSLYESGFDENFLSRALSIGNFGIGKNRKLVPTRWSITATDDTLGLSIIEEIKDYAQHEYAAYFGGYLGNNFLVLCFPQPWSYELFEMYTPKPGQWTTDYESVFGRATYVEETAGGYYACRLAVLEMLQRQKRQAGILVLRFITNEYIAPLGVWVVREATRKSVGLKPIIFASKELMLKYAESLARRKFNYDITQILKESNLLKAQQQKSLNVF